LIRDFLFVFSLETTTTVANLTSDNKLFKKILLIPSILLTKGLITLHVKASTCQIKDATNYLLQEQLLTSGKYLQSGKRQFEGYLKYVPENVENPKDKYLLQGRLLNVDVNVNQYIESLKFATTSLRPSNLLLRKLQETPYDHLNIDLGIERNGKCMS
jgi:hypothetical protein